MYRAGSYKIDHRKTRVQIPEILLETGKYLFSTQAKSHVPSNVGIHATKSLKVISISLIPLRR